ncbi:MAG: ABC transporter ATP-binding protein [Pseudobdellovibrionaceae bacterium]
MSLLKVENLSVHYGAIHALKKVSFEVRQGEVVSLIGCNGAGKTTTLRALSGIVPCAGKIEFEGKDIRNVPAYKRVGFGLAQSPEGRGVFPDLTVWENLEMGAYIRKNKENIEKDRQHAFDLFPILKERQKQPAGTLSGGEQQMLAISRALMTRPKLLLLDEPSLGLAPQIVKKIFDIIQKVNKEGMTILLVEQNARMALKFSHRAYVIETGNTTITGSGADLLANDEVRKAYLGI